MDDLTRPTIKMRDEDFIVWGFVEVAARHGIAAIECRSIKQLMDEHGQILLALEDRVDIALGNPSASVRSHAKKFIDTLKKSGATVTITNH